jgi:hypothetical protein
MDLLLRGPLSLMPGAGVPPALSLRDDRERARVAEAFVGDDADEAGSQVRDVLVVVLFPALRAWEAALGAAEAALVGRRMQLQAEGGCFGAALTQLAWTLRQPRGAPTSPGPERGAPLTEALAADLELALEVGRVRGDVERRADLAVATSRLGGAREDAARGRARTRRRARPGGGGEGGAGCACVSGSGVAPRSLPAFPRRRRASARPTAPPTTSPTCLSTTRAPPFRAAARRSTSPAWPGRTWAWRSRPVRSSVWPAAWP